MVLTKEQALEVILTKEQALEEAKDQKKALATLGKWRRWLFVITTFLAVIAFFGISKGEGWLVAGIIAVVLGAISLLMTFTVDISIRNGHRNVEKILKSLEDVKPS